WTGTILHVVNGALSVVAGFLLLMNPAAGAVVLTLLMAMFFLIGGLFRIVISLVTDLPHRGWVLLSGAVTLVLGIFIWRQLPGAAIWLIGTLVDVLMIVWARPRAALAPGRRWRDPPTPPPSWPRGRPGAPPRPVGSGTASV